MIEKVDHIGIAVKNMDESLKKYEKMFHVKADCVETMEAANLCIAFIPVGEVLIELLQPLTPGQGTIGEFLDKHGEGFHHIAYRVQEIAPLLAEMKKAGVALIDETPRGGAGGSRIAFISPGEANNVLVELVEREEELH